MSIEDVHEPEEGVSMDNEDLRIQTAAALRDLAHAFVDHQIDDDALVELRDWARGQITALDPLPSRSRMEFMLLALSSASSTDWEPDQTTGFEDRAVGGRANPTGLVFDSWREGDTMVTDITLGGACEGAPGRAHGGILLAAFDDFTGAIIGMLREPAFTGEIKVRFVQPVPIRTPLRLRTWLDKRDGRKLHIHADAHCGEQLIATCRALYITVDRRSSVEAPEP
jgi:hypothetical protein